MGVKRTAVRLRSLGALALLLLTCAWTGAYGLSGGNYADAALCQRHHDSAAGGSTDCCAPEASLLDCSMPMAGAAGCGFAMHCCASPEEPRIATSVSGQAKTPRAAIVASSVAIPVANASWRRSTAAAFERKHRPAVFDLKTDMRV